ncbi:CASP8-associated protein 2 isoform X2 [Corythoichthys intestinalis]|uniref:CASP8-associated protein 2 isoform X2 n=1 Tax=Corythoichthys intestinalis TaxID=161448 RepID=UPI0025A5696A|nr:CASP8-associated protein 2 isoform X2 [Corythoichthys intestinalis]
MESSGNLSAPACSPLQLKASMDLYEEIVTEEQQERESTYTELKIRFQAAQNQIKDLHRRLQQMEIQNKRLNAENVHLKKNISALLQTAKQEVLRKDTEIQRLNQSSAKGYYPPYRVNNLRDQNFTSQAVTVSMNRIPKSPPPSPSRYNSPSQPTLSSRDGHLPKVHFQPQRRVTDCPNNKDSGSCIEPRVSSCSHSKVSSSGHGLPTEKWNEHSVSNPSMTSLNRHHVSDKHKTREDKYQTHFATTDKKHGSTSSPSKNNHTIDKQSSHKSDTDTQRRHHSRTGQIRNSKNVNSYPRSERSRSPPMNNSQYSLDPCKESSEERRHKITQHSTHRSSTEEYSRRHKKPKISDEQSRSFSEHLDSKDQRRSSSYQRAESYTDFSKEKQRDRLAESYRWKGNRPHEEKKASKHRRESERVDEKPSPEKPSSPKHNTVHKERRGKRLKTSVKEPVEKSPQKRKLCFMETLNLTLSPVKSPVSNTGQDGLTAVNCQIENVPDDTLLADFNVINGIGNDLEEAPTDSVEPSTFKKLQGVALQEEVTSHCKAHLATQQASGQTISSSQSIDSAANRIDVEHTLKAQGSSSQMAKERKDEAKTKFSPDSQLGSNEQPDVNNYSGNRFSKVDTKQPSNPSQKEDNGSCKSQRIAEAKSVENGSKRQNLGTSSPNKLKKSADARKTTSLNQDTETSPQIQQPYLITLANDSQPGLKPSFSSSVTEQDACSAQDDLKDTNTVSSTISLEVVPQQEHRLPEEIHDLTSKDNIGSSCIVNGPSSSTDCIAVSKVSSTTEDIVPPQDVSALTDTQKESPCEKSPAKNFEACSSIPLLHDEDSMMRTLCHIKRIPAAISPLRSPVHLMKTSRLVVDGKHGHVKSLQKEFSIAAAAAAAGNIKKLDLNKKKKYLGCPGKYEMRDLKDKLSGVPSNILDTEQEDGEILTECEEIQSPVATKNVKVARILGKKNSESTCLASEEKTTSGIVSTQSPEFSFAAAAADGPIKKLDLNKENKHLSCPGKYEEQDLEDILSGVPLNISDTEQEEGEILTESEEAQSPDATKSVKVAGILRKKNSDSTYTASEEQKTSGNISAQSPGNKRFKTVCPTSSKASFSTIEEVMEMFASVRLEIRKKYMKLHKTFPRKSFFGVVENFRKSLLEFVDGAHFGQICCQATDLKSKLKDLIDSLFDKVTDNGIVKRIFEQQAVDLKQKLWVFVDNQVDFLLKDVHMTLKHFRRSAKTLSEENIPRGHESERLLKYPYERTQSQKDLKGSLNNLDQLKPFRSPYKTGLGSQGKNIRISNPEKEEKNHQTQNDDDNDSGVDHFSPQKPSISGKHKMDPLIASHSTVQFEKSDFELLTDQQTKSLTFNLVRDSQMGEIFKCLLHGTDLLETNEKTGETSGWALGTPKKNGERLLSITTPSKLYSPSKFLSPTKFDTPSKLVGTWCSMSLQEKVQAKPNPALFDESCLLEIPSENQATLQSGILSQGNPCILAEDLAVSLTIPSPLKSDSHLSFLQPSGSHLISTPDSVISAHIGEDALLDGEDASEQEIHLALDTDNSSLGSSNSGHVETVVNTFVLKPDLPMHALVMEKSNDHFILKIRQGMTFSTDERSNHTATEDNDRGKYVAVQESQEKNLVNKLHKYSSPSKAISSEYSVSDLSEYTVTCQNASTDISSTEDHLGVTKSPPRSGHLSITSKAWETEDLHNIVDSSKNRSKETPLTSCHLSSGQNSTLPSLDDEHPKPTVNTERDCPSPLCDSETISSDSQTSSSPFKDSAQGKSESSGKRISQDVANPSDLQGEVESSVPHQTVKDTTRHTEKDAKDCEKSKKRKRHHEQSKEKRTRRNEENCIQDSKNDVEPESLSISSNSLSAKNVIKKKGALVMAWTRDEDRAILVQLQTKGASRKTFAALSDMLNKPSEQISQRFCQLMNLLKKQGRMNT